MGYKYENIVRKPLLERLGEADDALMAEVIEENEHGYDLPDLLPLLERLDRGAEPTPEEQTLLEAVEYIHSYSFAGPLPKSISKMANLQHLRLTNAKISDISPLSGLEKLAILELVNTQVNDITPLAGLKNLQRLDLFGTQVSDITPLARLVNLQSLNLRDTQISDIAPLAKLTNLLYLDLSFTTVSDISPFGGLENLMVLYLQNTRVSNIAPLVELHHLRVLDLSGTQIRDISPLAGAVRLEHLKLFNTRVSNISSIAGLTNIESLDLSHTQVADISALREMSGLRYLYLDDTPVRDISVLRHIPKRPSGQAFRLTGLDLKSIPREVFEQYHPFVFGLFPEDGECYITLEDTTLSTQPISLFRQDRSVIQAYYDAEKVDVREAKVIFLGDGGAGKTHTIKRILNEDRDENIDTRTTLGISINSYPAKGDGGDFRINFWDFGGQENMHAMHRCFLTERTCYVVVISNRWNLDAQARYWLDNIRSFAPRAPVILAVNKWEGIPACPMDTNRLYRDYPNLREVTHYTAKGGSTEDFTSQLTRFIVRHAEVLDSNAMQLPEDWAAIRQNLMDSSKWYLDQDEYYKICAGHGLGGEENAPIRTWLLDWFNDLGICFSHHEEQSQYNVLNPRWLTSAIYILLNSADKIDTNGNVRHTLIERILRAPCEDDLARRDNYDYVLADVRYSKAECQHILAVMRKFGLSYPLPDGEEFIPALCGSEMPRDLYPTEYTTRISYEFRYSFLPDSLVQRLMVRLCPLPYSALWRRGFRFEETNLTAVVDAGGPDDTLRIDVFTQGSRSGKDTVMMLVDRIRALQQDTGMTAEEFIVVHGPRGEIPVPADMVLQAWQQNIPQLHLYSKENGLIAESPSKILGEAYSPEILEKAKELLQDKTYTASEAASTVIHKHYHDKVYEIHGDNIEGDQVAGDKYSQVIPGNLVTVLEKLIQENCQANQDFINRLLEQLEASNDYATREIAMEAKADSEKKRNILGTLRRTADAVGGVTSFLADSEDAGKTLLSIAGAITTAAKFCGPAIAEFIANLPPMIL